MLLSVCLYILIKQFKTKSTRHSDLYLAELVYAICSNNDISVEDLYLYRGTDRNDTVSLKQIAQRGILIVRAFGDACSICNDFIIDYVHREFPEAGDNEKIVIITSNMPERLKKSYFGNPSFSTLDTSLTIPLDQYHIPYLFYLDNEMRVKCLFIPDINYPELTSIYFKIVKERFFE